MRFMLSAIGLAALTGIALGGPLRGGRQAHAPAPSYPGQGQGVLVPYNYNPGAPTVVVVHGINLFPRLKRNTLAEQAARAAAQHGGHVNVVGWDWNNATYAMGLRPRKLIANARVQGDKLAAALQQAGIDPQNTHLVGHSLGTVVAAQAARSLAGGGTRVAGLTLLDVPARWHGTVYGQIGAATAADQVENIWAPGLTGLGRPANIPGVADRCSGTSPGGVFASLRPGNSNHCHCANEYVKNIGNGGTPASAPAVRMPAMANSVYAMNTHYPQAPIAPQPIAAPVHTYVHGGMMPAYPVVNVVPPQPIGGYVHGQIIPAYPVMNGVPVQPIGGYIYGSPVVPSYPVTTIPAQPMTVGGYYPAPVQAIPVSNTGGTAFVPASTIRER